MKDSQSGGGGGGFLQLCIGVVAMEGMRKCTRLQRTRAVALED